MDMNYICPHIFKFKDKHLKRSYFKELIGAIKIFYRYQYTFYSNHQGKKRIIDTFLLVSLADGRLLRLDIRYI